MTRLLVLPGDGIGPEITAATIAVVRAAADGTVSFDEMAIGEASLAASGSTLPEAVIHSAGHRNPFGHPHPEVWARWAQAGARNWRTDSQGAVHALLPPGEGDGVELSAQRQVEPRYWHGR